VLAAHQKALVVLSRKLFLLTATPFLITHSENLFGERARGAECKNTRAKKRDHHRQQAAAAAMQKVISHSAQA